MATVEYGRDDFESLDVWRQSMDQYVRLIEVLSGPGMVASSGGRSSVLEKEYFNYLSLGFHVAPTAGQDNHQRTWGTLTDARTGVIAPRLTKPDLLEALAARHVYATEDKNLRLVFRVNGRLCGDRLPPQTDKTLEIGYTLSDDDEPTAQYLIEVLGISLGNPIPKLVKTQGATGNTVAGKLVGVERREDDFLLFRITQSSGASRNKDRAWTAPIWFDGNPIGGSETTESNIGSLVAAKNSTVYHLSTCALAEAISPDDRVFGYTSMKGRSLHVGCPSPGSAPLRSPVDPSASVASPGTNVDESAKGEAPAKPLPWAILGAVFVVVLVGAYYRRLGRRQPTKAEPRLTAAPAMASFGAIETTVARRRIFVQGLNQVTGKEESSAIADVVFIHGLDGDAVDTWMAGGRDENYWPQWLRDQFPNIRVWSMSYSASSIKWKGNGTPLEQRAKWILDQFDLKRLGDRPIMFVCHSLGGLLIKQALRKAHDSKNAFWKKIIEQTKVIYFLSTPNSGSDIANWIKHLSLVLQGTATLNDLTSSNPLLLELNEWFRDNVGDLKLNTFVYCENLPTLGLIVVNKTSADPGIPGVNPIALDENHISICKPWSRQSPVYERAMRLLTDYVLTKSSLP